MSAHQPGRDRLFRFLSVVLSVCIVLAAAEMAFRLFWVKRLTVSAGFEHSHFHHRYNPYSTHAFQNKEFEGRIQNNRFGLRGADPVLPKPEGVFRILMLGDSFTYGFPVADDETFCTLIEHGLIQKGYPVEVINCGVSGYSPTLHYISLRDQFIQFDPDLVVVWYDLGDLQEDAWYQKNLITDEGGRILRCDPRYTHGRFDWGEWLRNHSALAKYFDVKLARTVQKMRTLGVRNYIRTKLRGERAKVAIARLKSKQGASDLAAHDRFIFVREGVPQEALAKQWETSAGYLRLMRDLLAERNIPFVLGIYPYGMAAGPEEWSEGRVAWGFEQSKVYSAQTALALFEQFSQTENIPLVNTFPSFRSAAGGRKLFYDWDGHFTPAGHEVLAFHTVNDPNFLRQINAPAGELEAVSGGSARILTGDVVK